MTNKITRVYVYQWLNHVNVFVERNDSKEDPRLYTNVSRSTYTKLRKILGDTNVKPHTRVSTITSLVRIEWTLI